MSLSYAHYFDSPKEVMLKQQVATLQKHYHTIQQEVESGKQTLAKLQAQDEKVYRLVLGAEPVAASVRQAGAGGTDQYADLASKDALIASTAKKVHQLSRELHIQFKSYEEIASMAKEKARRLAALPAISPLSYKNGFYLSSGFGMRKHPVQRIVKMHYGIDLAARRGTPVYATGAGVVKLAKENARGYGKHVMIDHGYGFNTKYCHMQSFQVKEGQRVERGQCIGYVGSTGTSTSPHLHYEVLKHNRRVNPVLFFFNDLDADQYEEMVELASRRHQTLS
ncbi:MAG: M23 family metallopeptidase [Roseivirga sp.]